MIGSPFLILSFTISSSMGEIISLLDVSGSESSTSEPLFSKSTDLDREGIESLIFENEFLNSLGRNFDTGEWEVALQSRLTQLLAVRRLVPCLPGESEPGRSSEAFSVSAVASWVQGSFDSSF